MPDWRAQVPEQVVRDYAAGRTSWREIRATTDAEDFGIMLVALGDLGLKLPRAPRERPSPAKQWLADVLADQAGVARSSGPA